MEWRDIEEFPGYRISETGNVASSGGRPLRLSKNQYGVLYVGMMRELDGEREQVKRSIALLVAKTFLPEPDNDRFDTPIHLDGDRSNCRADNLMWRPRWFAVMFHKQFKNGRIDRFTLPIQEEHTGEILHNSREACIRYGLLGTDILHSVNNGTFVFPTGQRFHRVEEHE
jgi:hypothetical protein